MPSPAPTPALAQAQAPAVPAAPSAPRRTALADLAPGQSFVDVVFVVRRIELRQARNGSRFLDLELGDASGAAPAKLWDADPRLYEELRGAEYLLATGRVELFNERKQLALSGLAVAEGPIDPLQFLPRTERSIRELFGRLGEIHRAIACPYLKALIRAFLGDEAFRRRFLLAPAAVSNHHAYLGGLIEHVVSLSEAGLKLCEAYPFLDRDLLLTGIFLHDIGKVDELRIGKALEYSDRGRLVGHIAQGVLWVEQRARAIPGFPEDTLEHLQHLVLSHHGTREWGSPVEPMTAEAIALHYLDNLDAKLAAFAKLVRDSGASPGAWTDYSPMLGRRMFKGTRARREEGVPEASPHALGEGSGDGGGEGAPAANPAD